MFAEISVGEPVTDDLPDNLCSLREMQIVDNRPSSARGTELQGFVCYPLLVGVEEWKVVTAEETSEESSMLLYPVDFSTVVAIPLINWDRTKYSSETGGEATEPTDCPCVVRNGGGVAYGFSRSSPWLGRGPGNEAREALE